MPAKQQRKKRLTERQMLEKLLQENKVIIRLLHKIEKLLTADNSPVSGYMYDLRIFENDKLITFIKGKFSMAITLTDSQQATYQLSFVDKKGKATDAASVVLSLDPAGDTTIAYDDPSNTVTIVAGSPGISTIKTVAKDSKGNVLPFDDEALEVTAGDAISGTRSEPVITDQP